jgi:hypothetical protein
MKRGLLRLALRTTWGVIRISQRGVRRAELDEEREPEAFTESHNRVLRRMKRWERVEAFGEALEARVEPGVTWKRSWHRSERHQNRMRKKGRTRGLPRETYVRPIYSCYALTR